MTPAPLSDRQVLERLVAFDSTSHNSNLPIADFICDYLDRPHVRVWQIKSPDGQKANVLIRIGPDALDDLTGGLVLSGHMDVVPANERDWESDPFVLTERDNRLFARGAADMKGFLALATNVARIQEPRSLRAPLVLIFTYDEEVGTLGAKDFVDQWDRSVPLPISAVIGEPTSWRPIRAHKGHVTVTITTEGKSAHSGLPHLGVNAIEPAARIVTELSSLRTALEREHSKYAARFPDTPYLALNVTMIDGGTAVNVVPDKCRLDVSIRTLPGTDVESLLDRVRAAAQRAVGDAYELSVPTQSPPMFTDESAPICRTVDQPVDDTGVSFATDAGWFQQLGLQCLIFGPGSIEVAHKPNEFLPTGDLVRGRDYLDRLVREFCQPT